ncbi:hypothetical protein BKA70DRAFT_347951 [Coprinopsis sp. MPI-PUGE-AT-0042]|nr:hypothetical protein BKA70DRAFT_347951 [Coprinopsis sp. MPI-PUGE-AT-0042]
MTLRTSVLSASFSSSSSTGSLSGYNSPVSSSVSTPATTSLVCTPSTSVHSDDGREYFDRKAAESFKAEQFFKAHDRVSELWFEDGNLILQAENTIFRIYRGHLSARSSVFRDMFEFPPPAEGNRTLDGVPIVEVYDEAEDMKNFLKALLDSEFFEPPPSPTTLHITHSILKLSTKYDVRYLRLRALAHLQSTYPTTLEAWHARDTTRTIPSVENTPFAALQIASEFGLDWLVPSVVYCISSHDITKTLDSAIWVRPGRRSKKRQVKLEDGSDGEEEEKEDDNKLELGWPEKRICLAARNKLLLIQNAHALSIVRHHRPAPTADSPKCTGEEDKCHRTRLRIADILTRWGTAGFLDFFDEQYEAFAGDFCEVCRKDFKSTHAEAVQELWDILPKVCGFEGGWRELERVRGLCTA